VPGSQVWVLTPTAFQALIETIRQMSAAVSFSLNTAATSSNASRGTWVSTIRTTASQKASAARSRASKKPVSRQALRA
jgi:hypothetical protein